MVFESLVEAIADVLEIETSEIKEESRFLDDLGADSLDIMEIIMNLEEKLNIKIPIEAASNIKTVGDAVKEIEAVVNK